MLPLVVILLSAPRLSIMMLSAPPFIIGILYVLASVNWTRVCPLRRGGGALLKAEFPEKLEFDPQVDEARKAARTATGASAGV